MSKWFQHTVWDGLTTGYLETCIYSLNVTVLNRGDPFVECSLNFWQSYWYHVLISCHIKIWDKLIVNILVTTGCVLALFKHCFSRLLNHMSKLPLLPLRTTDSYLLWRSCCLPTCCQYSFEDFHVEMYWVLWLQIDVSSISLPPSSWGMLIRKITEVTKWSHLSRWEWISAMHK